MLVDDVLVQLQELTDIVGDLAELARGDQGPASREPLRLDLLVQDEVAVQNTHGRSKDVRFDLDAAPVLGRGQRRRPAPGRGQPARQRPQVEPSRRAGLVECRDGTVVVRDHGPGIAEADLPHIFDRFYRSPAARGLPGSGLGLAIVAQVVKAEGGTIVAENDPRGGARMTMRLPTITGTDAARAGRSRTMRQRRPDRGSRPRLCLSSRILRKRQCAAQVRGAEWVGSTPGGGDPTSGHGPESLFRRRRRRWGRSAAVPAGASPSSSLSPARRPAAFLFSSRR